MKLDQCSENKNNKPQSPKDHGFQSSDKAWLLLVCVTYHISSVEWIGWDKSQEPKKSALHVVLFDNKITTSNVLELQYVVINNRMNYLAYYSMR